MRCFGFILCLSTACPTLFYKNSQQKNAPIYLEYGFYKDGSYQGRRKKDMVEITEQNGDSLLWYQKGICNLMDPHKYAEVINFVGKLKRHPGFWKGDQQSSTLEVIIGIMGNPDMRHTFYEAVELGVKRLKHEIDAKAIDLSTNENIKSAQEKIYRELEDGICQIFDLYPTSPQQFYLEVVKAMKHALITLCATHAVGLDRMLGRDVDYTQQGIIPSPEMVNAYYGLSPCKVYGNHFAGPYKDALRGKLILLATLPPYREKFLIEWDAFAKFWGETNLIEVIQYGAALLESDLKNQKLPERYLDPANEECLGTFTAKIDHMMNKIEDCLIYIFYLAKKPEEIRDFFMKGGVFTSRINGELSAHETLDIQSILERFAQYFKIGIGIITKPSNPSYKFQDLVKRMLKYAESVMRADPVIYTSGVVIYLNEVHIMKPKDPILSRPICCSIQ